MQAERWIFDDDYLTAISPNGQYVAGDVGDGSVIIRNLATGELKVFVTEGDEIMYRIGGGSTPISNTGIVVGSTTGENAAYFENNAWHELPVPNTLYTNTAKAITPDGSIICGNLGRAQMTLEHSTAMCVPAVWYRQEDGTYSEPEILPCPEYDFTGRVPQYITALSISADGKVIAGQVHDNGGMVEEPIIYYRDENGDWAYKLLYPELINPTGVKFPPYPGEFDEAAPSEEQFMTPEELQAFQAANAAGKEPQYVDYMTEEEYQEYVQAMTEYLSKFEPWQKEFENFLNLYYTCLGTGYAFIFNNAMISPDGTQYIVSREVATVVDPTAGPEGIKVSTFPVVMNVDGSGYKNLDGTKEIDNLNVISVAEDGSVLSVFKYFYADGAVTQGYIFPPGETAAVPLHEYIATWNQNLATWMEDNMLQEVAVDVVVSPSGQASYVFTDFLCSGAPVCTPDLKRIVTFTTSDYWRNDPGFYFVSYVFDTDYDPTGVEGVEASDSHITVLPGGVIALDGEFSHIDIYDLSGSVILSVSNPAERVATGLAHGIYILKAIDANGEKTTLKIAL